MCRVVDVALNQVDTCRKTLLEYQAAVEELRLMKRLRSRLAHSGKRLTIEVARTQKLT